MYIVKETGKYVSLRPRFERSLWRFMLAYFESTVLQSCRIGASQKNNLCRSPCHECIFPWSALMTWGQYVIRVSMFGWMLAFWSETCYIYRYLSTGMPQGLRFETHQCWDSIAWCQAVKHSKEVLSVMRSMMQPSHPPAAELPSLKNHHSAHALPLTQLKCMLRHQLKGKQAC